jgi:transcription elongation factor GreB
MGRWRPPAEGSTALITREGHDRLKAELDGLWRVKRLEVAKALAAAAARSGPCRTFRTIPHATMETLR